ncbi:MAG: glycosyltransferase [Lachnospiraceae bacterium]|nr:glycosyltransferase [Lachnospiraceae bacterium]
MESRYTWDRWFEEAYLKQKNLNMNLTSRLVDAGKRREETYAKLTRITGSLPFRIINRLKGTKPVNSKAGSLESRICTEYEEKIACRQDLYGEWISRNEGRETAVKEAVGKANDNVKIISFAGFCRMLSSEEKADGILLVAEDTSCLERDVADVAFSFFAERKEYDLWTANEDMITADGKRHDPFFKTVNAPETMLGYCSYGSFFAVRAALYNEILAVYGKVAAALSDTVHDMTDRESVCLFMLIASDDRRMGLTDRVLYHCRQELPESSESDHFDYRNALNFYGYDKRYAMIRKTFLKTIKSVTTEVYRTSAGDVYSVYPVPEGTGMPKVSVIILSKDNPLMLNSCIKSILDKTDYPEYEFIIVDNGSDSENRPKISHMIASFSEKTGKHFDYIYHREDFNFSAMCNRGAADASGELLLFLNDDVQVIEENWMKIMAGTAMQEKAGAVGAKLWYPDDMKIQHAGITNLAIGPAHKLIGFPDTRIYYYGAAALPCNMSAVTGACLMIRKSVFEEAGRFDESLPVEYNDVDLCFTLIEKGYRNIQRNDAVLLHLESASRGQEPESIGKAARLIEVQKKLYDKHKSFEGKDPYYSHNLSKDSSSYLLNVVFDADDPEKKSDIGKIGDKEKEEYARAVKNGAGTALKCTVEFADIQKRNRKDDHPVLCISGWAYVQGKDNACFDISGKSLILLSEDGGECLRVSLFEKYRPDAQKVMYNEKNIALSGFTGRIDTSDIRQGRYHILTEYTDRTDGQRYIAVSDKKLNNPGTVC